VGTQLPILSFTNHVPDESTQFPKSSGGVVVASKFSLSCEKHTDENNIVKNRKINFFINLIIKWLVLVSERVGNQ
jgi:hypothetical protein